ncbi:hypothetical protein [Aliarcobacter butzleri]|uniref:hypothetical protein n=1 Tax=Aliarcobacter butzleri TaxID=28197 RepID=UPI0021B69FF3|nr:hypothetical protein [Aliarcobacter butzleri]MCT7642454.1 hypothetical protein [Aliarcobacter butzleri]
MLNIEELLIKIIQILDFDMKDVKLKQTLEKRRFYTHEVKDKKYKELISLIFDKLNIDTQNEKLVDIFIDLINLYLPIYNKINLTRFIATQEKINWVILKRLVIPYLAKRFSSLDYDYNLRIDKGLSGGKFWYFPDITEYSNVKLPMEYVMNWWLDLYGKSLDSLCDEIDDNPNENKPEKGSKNTIKQWIKKSLPDRNSIEQYSSIPLSYKGIFEVDENDSIDIQFKKACDFIINVKKLSIDNLKHEIPYHSLVDKIFIEKKSISDSNKKEFVKLIKERWAKPTAEKLINNFIIARSSQNIYKELLKYFSFKDSNDIEVNKLLQLVYLYSFIYNENLQRELYQTEKYDILDIVELNYEYLDCFNNDFDGIIETISNDINIELSNQKYSKDYLEDIYQVKVIVYSKNDIFDKLKIAFEELEEHQKFFHEKFDNIEQRLEDYFSLKNENDKIDFIESVDDFELLLNINEREIFNINYNLAEKCLFKMQKISNSTYYEIQVLSNLIGLYVLPFFEENIIKYEEANILIDKYEELIKNSPEHNIQLLEYKIYFCIKSKQFDKALKESKEYFNGYIKNEKKNEDKKATLFMCAYSAYIKKDNGLLKEINKILKKSYNLFFENSKSIPFKIFFYKK